MKNVIRNIVTACAIAISICSPLLSWQGTPAWAEEPQDASASASLAVVSDVKFARQGGAEVIEVTADKPLVYSYYRLSGPPRAVVDLAQTEPGTYADPLTFESSQVKQVRLAKHELTSGTLTRIEMDLINGSDFTVKAAPGDKRKLLITFIPAAAAPGAAASVAAPPKQEPPRQAQAKAAAAPEQVSVPPAKGAGPAAATGTARKLTDISVVEDGIDIVADAPFASYTSFPMTKPERLVIDLPGVRIGMAKKVTIGAFGVDSARLGEHLGKTRIVFEGKPGSFKKGELVKTSTGLKLVFGGKGDSGAPAANRQSSSEKTSPKAGQGTTSQVDALDFSMIDTGSRVAITVSGECRADKPSKNSEGVTLSISNCKLPRNLQRTLDTSAFPTVVQSVVPYQVMVGGAPETRVLVKLDRDVEFSQRREGNAILFDVTHPKMEKQAAKAEGAQEPRPATDAPAAAAPAAPAAPQGAVGEVAAKKLQESAQAPLGSKKVYTGRRVTLEFVDADIRKIFQLIAEVSNLNFLIGDDVSGTITIKLVNVPWDQALDMILETKGLGMKVDGNIVQIKPKSKFKSIDEEILEAKRSREKMMDLQTKVFDVNFAQLGDVVAQFRTLGSGRTDATITPDERTNKVIVTDIELAIKRMQKLLENIDVPEKQVMIEARIVEATNTFTQSLGIQWGIHYRDGSGSFLGINAFDTGFGGIVTQTPPLIGTSGPGMATGISFGKLASNFQLDLRLSAAATAEQIKIVSTPKIATLNNKPAKITQGQSIPYQNTTANTGAVTQFVEAALTLEVTPHVTPDGSVMMKIKASNNSAGTGTPPPINKKEATTELLVKNGETTVIGGIYVDNDTDLDSGVPFLKDIPYIGYLFKSNTKLKQKTELLIFITPRILI